MSSAFPASGGCGCGRVRTTTWCFSTWDARSCIQVRVGAGDYSIVASAGDCGNGVVGAAVQVGGRAGASLR